MIPPGLVPRRVVVPERGTALRRSRVCVGDGAEFWWQRKAGPSAPEPLLVPDGPLRAALASGRTRKGSALVPPHLEQEWVTFRTRAPRSLSEELVTGSRPDDDTVLAGLNELGRLLRLVHALDPGPVGPQVPGAVARLGAWLCGREPAGRVGEVTRTVRSLVGGQRWQLLGEWCADVAERPETLVHGWCGLGHVALDDAGRVDLCIGDDLGVAPPELDLGGVMAQLHELRTFRPAPPTLHWCREAAAALLDGYGPADAPQVARCTALALALHVHDFAHYFDVRDVELPHWGRLLCHRVDQAAG